MNGAGILSTLLATVLLLSQSRAYALTTTPERCPRLHPTWMQTDTDQDGLADHLEDTNQNGVTDPGETDARLVDTDQDGLSDALEDRNRNGRVDPGETDPRRADTDGDRIPDGVEDRNRNGRWDPGETSPTARCTGGHCRVLEDVDSPNRGPLVPEPMVVDLVRNLGAMQGELEANVLFMLPLRNPWVPYWAPEVEIAFATGWAVELEVPIVGLHVDAFKLGLQGTLGVSTNQRLATGVQWLLEARSDGSHAIQRVLARGLRRRCVYADRSRAGLCARAPDVVR
jgi:hypothetical protein